MKQAILITAYKNFNHLIDLIDFFDDDFEIFIHIDKKSILEKTTIDNIKFIKAMTIRNTHKEAVSRAVELLRTTLLAKTNWQTDSHPPPSPFARNLKLFLVNRKVMLYGL